MAGQREVPGDQAQDLGHRAQVDEGEELGEEEEHGHPEDQFGDDVGEDHDEVEGGGRPGVPAVDADGEGHAQGDGDDGGEDRQPERLLDGAARSSGLWATELMGSPQYQRMEKPCHDALGLAVVEGEEDGDADGQAATRSGRAR